MHDSVNEAIYVSGLVFRDILGDVVYIFLDVWVVVSVGAVVPMSLVASFARSLTTLFLTEAVWSAP